MRDRILDKLPRLLLTLLLAAGFTLTFLGAMRLDPSPAVFLVITLGALALEAVGLTRRSALWGNVALTLPVLIWVFSDSGFSQLADVFRALTLAFSGVPGALPLVSAETALLVSSLVTLFSFFASRKSAGGLPALLLFVGALILLWQSDRPDLVLPLLPAGLSAICLLLLDHHPTLSLLRVMPWIAAMLLLSWTLTPRSGAVIPSLKEKADAFRQAVMDRLFFTEPREVFSLSTEGFYPEGVSQLGGPANPTDHPVMQVSAPRSVYLRGVILNEYDGRSWRNSLGGRRFLWDAAGMAGQRTQLFDQNLPSPGLSSALTEPVDVSVRMLSGGASTLFLPQRVRDLRTGGEIVPYFTNSSEVFMTRNLQAGDSWSVSAPLFQAGDPGISTLIEAASAAEDQQYEFIRETYTILPSHLEEPVWQLATDITEGLVSPYEKAFALQNWLSRNYRYTLDAEPHPANLDFVTAFLFSTREGYCTYFASALTVLCRMAGLPARYVEGYLAVPDASGHALVTGLNAHAWTEVYFQGFGWLTLDATPRQTGVSDGPESPESTPDSSVPPEPTSTPTPEPPESPDSSEGSDGEPEKTPFPDETEVSPPPSGSPGEPDPDGKPEPLRPPSPWLWLLLILLLLAALLLLRWFLTSPARKERSDASEEARFDSWLEDVLRRLSAAGWSRSSGETLMSFTRRLDQEASLSVRLSTLGECASLLHYGKVNALETDTALARSVSLDLRKTLPFRARLRYAFRRLLPRRTVFRL